MVDRTPVSIVIPTLCGRAAARRRGPVADRPAPHQVAPRTVTLVAPRGEPRPPAPRAVRALREREAGGLPRPLGVRALSRAVRDLLPRRRSAERAAQDPALAVEA